MTISLNGRNRGPTFHPIATGIVLALYASDILYDLEIQRAPDVSGVAGTWATIASEIPGSTELYTDRLAQNADVHWYRMRSVGFGDTPSDWTASVFGTGGMIPASVVRPPAPKLSLRNVREKSRNTTQLVSQWDRDPRQDAVDVWETLVIGTLTGSPWPEKDAGTGLYPTPDLVLADTATTITFDIPSEGVLYAFAVPVDKYGKPGIPAKWTVVAVGVRPVIYGVRQVAGLSGLFADFWASIQDAQDLGGTLTVWLNHDSPNDADPSGVSDGTLAIASTPFDATPSTVFAKTGGGTAALLDNIRVHKGTGKQIAMEFVNSLGVSSGQQRYTLLPGPSIIDASGLLVDEAIITAKNFAASFRPPQPVSVLPPSDVLYGDKVVLTTDRKLYQWISGAWVANTAPATTLLNTLYGGAAVFGVVDAVAIQATSITAFHMNIGILSDISANMGIILAGKLQAIDGLTYLDLNATGTNPILHHAGLDLKADGSAVFAGTVSASSFTASTATFADTLILPRKLHLGDVTGATFEVVCKLSGTPTFGVGGTIINADYSAARGVGLRVGTGAFYASVLDVNTDLFLPGGQVSYGAANSGGAGLRNVLVPN